MALPDTTNSFFVGAPSSNVNSFEPNVSAGRFLSRAQLPMGMQRPQHPEHLECFMDRRATPPTLIWYDRDAAEWQNFAGTKVICGDKFITEFSFLKSVNPGLDKDYKAVISNSNITVTLPHGTVVTSLKASFVHSNLSEVTIGVTSQVSGVTANNFTNPVTYTVTAEDTSDSDYTVTVTVAPAV